MNKISQSVSETEPELSDENEIKNKPELCSAKVSPADLKDDSDDVSDENLKKATKSSVNEAKVDNGEASQQRSTKNQELSKSESDSIEMMDLSDDAASEGNIIEEPPSKTNRTKEIESADGRKSTEPEKNKIDESLNEPHIIDQTDDVKAVPVVNGSANCKEDLGSSDRTKKQRTESVLLSEDEEGENCSSEPSNVKDEKKPKSGKYLERANYPEGNNNLWNGEDLNKKSTISIDNEPEDDEKIKKKQSNLLISSEAEQPTTSRVDSRKRKASTSSVDDDGAPPAKS